MADLHVIAGALPALQGDRLTAVGVVQCAARVMAYLSGASAQDRSRRRALGRAQPLDAGGYGNVVADVVAELTVRLDRLTAAGIDPDRIVVDPGIGFAKTAAQSWQLLRGLEELATLGRPIRVGASRNPCWPRS